MYVHLETAKLTIRVHLAILNIHMHADRILLKGIYTKIAKLFSLADERVSACAIHASLYCIHDIVAEYS